MEGKSNHYIWLLNLHRNQGQENRMTYKGEGLREMLTEPEQRHICRKCTERRNVRFHRSLLSKELCAFHPFSFATAVDAQNSTLNIYNRDQLHQPQSHELRGKLYVARGGQFF